MPTGRPACPRHCRSSSVRPRDARTEQMGLHDPVDGVPDCLLLRRSWKHPVLNLLKDVRHSIGAMNFDVAVSSGRSVSGRELEQNLPQMHELQHERVLSLGSNIIVARIKPPPTSRPGMCSPGRYDVSVVEP